MRTHPPQTYVVVVTYNAEKWLDQSLGCLAQIPTELKTIVVDNKSTDRTCELIARLYPAVDLIQAEQNLGFGVANNVGIKRAFQKGAEYTLLLNQDAWLAPDALTILINAHLNNPTYGIISPMHLNGEGTALDFNFARYMNAGENDRSLLSDLYLKGRPGMNALYPVRFVNAAIWLLPRKTVQSVGGFNPLFFMYGEDIDYVNRCRYRGWRIGVAPHAVACHGRPQQDSESKIKKIQLEIQKANLLDPNGSFTMNAYLREQLARALLSAIRWNYFAAGERLKEIRYFWKFRKRMARLKEQSTTRDMPFL